MKLNCLYHEIEDDIFTNHLYEDIRKCDYGLYVNSRDSNPPPTHQFCSGIFVIVVKIYSVILCWN